MTSGSTNPTKPVVFLAFANEQEGKRYLRELPGEARELRAALQKAEDRGLCELEIRTNVTLDELVEVFNRHGRRVAIFHYAGHAGPDRLLLESSTGAARVAHAGGLARLLGLQGGLQLVFLNGCSTGPQVAELLAAGVDAVVATARPIDDAIARAFAVAFYSQLEVGRSIRDAFTVAGEKLKLDHGNAPRDFIVDAIPFSTEDIADDLGFPWRLHVRDGAEAVEQESLPKLARKPLLGLPPLPPATWLPPSPYRHLQRFTHEQAHVFFGRGQEIADLYGLVISPTARRVILYSGPTGVGKSSVLDAGVLPRLAATHEVVYLRRDAASGLLGTLGAGLMAPGDGSAPAPDLGGLWRARETPERPLVVVLDQAEEAFTRPRSGGTSSQEVAELVRGLQTLFQDPVHSPRGRLILGFRKEWLQEFERAYDDARLGYESLRLGPLDHNGIVEVIEGPTLADDLRRHYGLTIAPGLADRIANELDRDAGSALAPTLQVLLTKMWTAAGGKQGSFTGPLYDQLENEGFLLNDVLDEGLTKLSAWRTDVVDSGFALDLLEYHTTRYDTAETRTRADLLERYGHRADVLDECLRICESSYLLIPAETKPGGALAALRPEADSPTHEPVPTRLGHDTLAPLVRERCRASSDPGQRARRLLENRAPEWHDNAMGHPLDRPDLETVERGLAGMRRPTDDERRLIDASREAGARRQVVEEERQRQLREARDQQQRAEARTRKVWRGAAIVLGVFCVGLVGMTVWAWIAQENATRETAEVLTQSGISTLELGHTFEAMHLFAQAVATLSSDARAQADNRLRLSFLEPGHVPALRSIFGHAGWVYPVAFSPDWARLVTGLEDQTARVWSVSDGKLIAELKGHAGRVNSAAFSPDGARLVTASDDRTARVWSAADGKPIAELKGHAGWVYSARFSPDGARVVTTSFDRTARVWSAADGKLIAELKGHALPVMFAVFSPDGAQVVTGSWDQTARVWNAADARPIAELKGHAGWVCAAAFSPDGARIVTASEDQTARVWSAADGKPIAELKGHVGWMYSTAFSPDGARVVTASEDRTARIWSAADGTPIAELKGHALQVVFAAFSPDGARVVTASLDRTARIWSASDGKPITELKGHANQVVSAAFSPDGARVVTASGDTTARVWNAANGKPIAELKRHAGWVYSAAFSPDGARVVTASEDHTARVWGASDGKPIAELKGHALPVHSAVFSQDGARVVTASEDHTARVWSATDGKPIAELKGHANWVNSATFSPDGARVVTASTDQTARIWSASNGKPIAELKGHAKRVYSAAFSPDGARVVTASDDQTARVWSASDGKPIAELKGHANWVNSAAFSPDGVRVVTASGDETARVWSASDGKLIAELKGHALPVTSALFSPDGAQVVTASWDHRARVWSASDGKLIAELKGHAGWVKSAVFSPDGARVATASEDYTARVWPLGPLKGETETIPLWVQAYTGTELQGGTIRALSNDEWKTRCRELRAYGTKAPPSPWLDGLDLAAPPARP